MKNELTVLAVATALTLLFAPALSAVYGAVDSDAAVASNPSTANSIMRSTQAAPIQTTPVQTSAQAAVVAIESGKQIVKVAEAATTLVSVKNAQPIKINGQDLTVAAPATVVSASSGGGQNAQNTQAAPVVELSVAAVSAGEPLPPLPPNEANEPNVLPVEPIATSAPVQPVQAIPIEQQRAAPPLNVGHLGPWHSMWSEGCVAHMRAPLNRVTYVYRQVRKCADGSFLDEKANQLMFLHGGYCNFNCQNRYYEQCVADGSFDAYYVEQCLEITLPTPGLAPNDIPLPQISETVEVAPIAIDADSRVYNSGCQASLPEPFNQVARVEREVRSCADDSLQQKQTILTKGNYCGFDCVDLKSETCVAIASDAAGAAGASGVYITEKCFTSEAAEDARQVTQEQAQVVRAKLKRIRVERVTPATTAAAPTATQALKISSADDSGSAAASAVTQLDVLVKNQVLYVKPADASEAQAKPVAVLPDAVKAVAVAQGAAPASVSGMQLKIDDASGKAVYEIDAAKPVKIMGFIPASMPVTTTVSAVDASVVSEKTPWWKAISTS